MVASDQHSNLLQASRNESIDLQRGHPLTVSAGSNGFGAVSSCDSSPCQSQLLQTHLLMVVQKTGSHIVDRVPACGVVVELVRLFAANKARILGGALVQVDVPKPIHDH
jgi:hypothetical protein